MEKIKPHIQKKFILGFFCFLLIPNIILLIGKEKNPLHSKYKSLPSFDFKNPSASFSKYKNYYLENYGSKTSLVNFYIDVKRNYLKENELPNKVFKGYDDWYFLGNDHSNTLNHAFGINPLTEFDLYIMKKNLLNFKKYLINKGIDFYIVIPPNKNTIYRDKLPFQISKKSTPLKQFIAFLNDKENDFFIDFEDLFLTKKDTEKLFYKTNSHWNDSGAFIAYEEVMKVISKKNQITNHKKTISFIKQNDIIRGDLINMININSYENDLFYKNDSSTVKRITNKYNYKQYINPESSDLSLLMYRDSFAINWFKFFPEDFKKTIFMRYDQGIRKKDIEKENPDIIILEIAERNLVNVLKSLKLD